MHTTRISLRHFITLAILAFVASAPLTAQTFSSSGTMVTPRYNHTATLLPSGVVLLAGGSDTSGNILASAEIFNPMAGTFASTGNLNTGRAWDTATLLPNGLVLFVGGADANYNVLSSAELYNPATGTFSQTGSLNTARFLHTATLLDNGMVLIAGGEDANGDMLASAELYNPATGTFSYTGNLNVGRAYHTATTLDSGQVLIAGGFDSSYNVDATAEVYDPTAATFTFTGSMNTARYTHTATLLNNGNVLIAGGYDVNYNTLASAEIFNPTTGAFTTTGSLIEGRGSPTATLLNDGQVLFVGGTDQGTNVPDAELYDPVAASFSQSGTPSAALYLQTATLLPGGNLLLAGGVDDSDGAVGASQSYQPSTLTPTGLVSIAVTPANPPVFVGSSQQLTATGTFSDNSAEDLASASWASSNTAVATVTNDATNEGLAIASAAGTATITACTGSICGSTTITSSPTLTSIAVSPSSPTLGVGASQQFTATGSYSDGSQQNLTTSATWSTSDSSVATMSNTTETQGFSVAMAVGSATITATLGNVSGSSSVTVVSSTAATAPSISSISPTSGSAGTQITVNGFGFGSSQGNGYVWIGSTIGIVNSWSDTQIMATVASGASSGMVQVQQGGQQSNGISFTVITPTVTSVTPTDGLAGTSVTITGSGFGSSQGSGQVELGTAAGVVTSWSDTQVTATVASGAASGNAQVLQNGVWSNAVAFTVDAPQITNISPTSASVGATVTISGSGFGASQGSGVIWLGSTYGTIETWSATQITASVASGALSGIVRVQQNSIWSNSEAFTVTPSDGSTALTITPDVLNIAVGDTHQLRAVNPQGQSVTGLTWASSDTTIATLSTDDPPILTAIAAGHVTITAGNASADVTVLPGTLPVGTIQWSNAGDGSGVSYLDPAVPSSAGIDVFGFLNSGNVAAITADGQTAWTASLNGGYGVPDFLGGLEVVTGMSMYELQGATGQANPAYTFTQTAPNYNLIGYGTDGTIFAVDGGAVVGIDPTTGTAKFSVPMSTGTEVEEPYCENPNGGSSSATTPNPYYLIVAGDGNAYVVYSYSDSDGDPQEIGNCDAGYGYRALHLHALQVSPSGGAADIDIADWTQATSSDVEPLVLAPGGGYYNYLVTTQTGSVPSISLAPPLTSSNTGILVSWSASAGGYCAYQSEPYGYEPQAPPGSTGGCVAASTNYYLGLSSGGVATQQFPGQAEPVVPILQREDGTFVGTVGIGPAPDNVTQTNMVAFNLSGYPIFSLPNFYPEMAVSGGDVIAQSNDGLTTSMFDTNGNATAELPNFPTYSWKGAYQVGSIDSIIPAFDQGNVAPTFAAVAFGNLTGNGTNIAHHTLSLFWCGVGLVEQGHCSSGSDIAFSYVTNPTDQNISTAQDFSKTYPQWVFMIESKALSSYRQAFSAYPLIVSFAASSEYTAYVVGTWPVPSFGLDFQDSPAGNIYYFAAMGDSQVALGQPEGPNCSESWCDLTLSYPPQSPTDPNFLQLMAAIGTSIGNAAAHETGHYFENIERADDYQFPYMDCGLGNTQVPNPIDCENGNDFVYSFWAADGFPHNPSDPTDNGGQFFFLNQPGEPAIHWGPSDACWIYNYSHGLNVSKPCSN